jgi:hypothetical protein
VIHWSDSLPAGACAEARDWCLTQPSYEAAWEACERGDWLLWLAGRLDVDRRLLVRAACACVRLALVHVPTGEGRPRRAVETAEAWTRGEASLEEVRDAARAAYAADAFAVYASDATGRAACAASAAYAAACAASAAYAAAFAADAVYAAASDAADAATLAECVRLVRGIITRPDLRGAP